MTDSGHYETRQNKNYSLLENSRARKIFHYANCKIFIDHLYLQHMGSFKMHGQ